MASIVNTPLPSLLNTAAGGGVFGTCTVTTMTASDTLDFNEGTGQILILRNPTGGALTPVLVGVALNHPIAGWGKRAVGSGYSVGAIAAGGYRVIPLDTLRLMIQGAITITGGTGLHAILLNPIP